MAIFEIRVSHGIDCPPNRSGHRISRDKNALKKQIPKIIRKTKITPENQKKNAKRKKQNAKQNSLVETT